MGSMLSAFSGPSIDSIGKCVPTGENAAQMRLSCCRFATQPRRDVLSRAFYLKVSRMIVIRLDKALGLKRMRLWQRLVATLLLIVFVPASLAAALPLVYCYGADGHRAIEFVESAPHHDARRAHAATKDAHLGMSVGMRGGCVDVEVVPLTSVSQRGPDGKAVPCKWSPSSTAIFADSVCWSNLSNLNLPRWPRTAIVIDRLASHRTVVLLI